MPYWTYVVVGLIACVAGYLVNRLMVELSFRPVTRRFGWQGVIASNSTRIAAATAEIVTGSLTETAKLFDRIDPEQLATEIEQPLLRTIDNITRDVLAEHHAGVWESLPPIAQDIVIKSVQGRYRELVTQLWEQLNAEANAGIDLKLLTVQSLRADPARITSTIRDSLSLELGKFSKTGAITGFAIGVLAAATLALSQQPLALLGAAIVLGFAAPTLGYQIAIRPSIAERRGELAEKLADIISAEIITVRNLTNALLHGPRSDTVAARLRTVVSNAVDNETLLMRPLRATAAGRRRSERMKDSATAALMSQLPALAQHAQLYLTEAMAVRAAIAERIERLSAADANHLVTAAFGRRRRVMIAVSTASIAFCATIGLLPVLAPG